MSYDYDSEENKTFYEHGINDGKQEMTFEQWYEVNRDDLIDEYIFINPEEFGSSEDYDNIEDNGRYQSYCENEYDEHLGGLRK